MRYGVGARLCQPYCIRDSSNLGRAFWATAIKMGPGKKGCWQVAFSSISSGASAQ